VSPVRARYSPSRPGLGHREPGSLGDDAHGGVAGETDAAAHGDAVGEGDDGGGVFVDRGVEGVLLPEEHPHLVGPARDDRGGEGANVAARAEAAITGAVEQHGVDVGVTPPGVERRPEGTDHVHVERVDRRRAVEGEAAERVLGANHDAGIGGVHVGHGATLPPDDGANPGSIGGCPPRWNHHGPRRSRCRTARCSNSPTCARASAASMRSRA
jgi:hypothetical protein